MIESYCGSSGINIRILFNQNMAIMNLIEIGSIVNSSLPSTKMAESNFWP